MRTVWTFVAAAVIMAGPAAAQGPDPKAALNAANWDMFLKLYPPRALKAREEGAVGFKVVLDSKGDVTGCEVTHSSGHPLLDQETCNLVTLHAQFKPDPTVAASQVTTHDGMIAWRLPGGAAALNRPTAVSTDPGDKIVCKKSVRTGSLAGIERTCLSQREWARQSDESKQPWDELQGRKGSTSGN